jgi:hypothetical protein
MMKRLLFIPLLFLCSNLWAAGLVLHTTSGFLPVGTACSSYASGGGIASYSSYGTSAGTAFGGLARYVPAANITLCKVAFNPHAVSGDLTGFVFTAYVYTQDAAGDIVAASPQCTSSTVLGPSIVADTDMVFNFTSCNLVTTQANGYAIVFKHNQAVGAGNYVAIHDSTDLISGAHLSWFTAAGALSTGIDYATDNPMVTIYKVD